MSPVTGLNARTLQMRPRRGGGYASYQGGDAAAADSGSDGALGSGSVSSGGGGGGVLFFDNYASGSESGAQNGVGPIDGINFAVVAGVGKSGTPGLQFTYPAAPSGVSSFSQREYTLGANYNEIWIAFDFFVPPNYVHRADGEAGANNNKFTAIYANPYGSPGFQINFSTARINNSTSKIISHLYNNGSEIEPVGDGGNLITAADLGQWLRIVQHAKVPTGLGSNNGVQEMWKNGNKIFGHTDLGNFGSGGRNYMNRFYLPGWANSGYLAETKFVIDNLTVSTSNIDGVS